MISWFDDCSNKTFLQFWKYDHVYNWNENCEILRDMQKKQRIVFQMYFDN